MTLYQVLTCPRSYYKSDCSSLSERSCYFSSPLLVFVETLFRLFFFTPLGKLQRLQFLFITEENIYFFFQWCDGLLVMCLLESSAASRFLSSCPSLCLTLPIPLCVQFGMYSHYNLELPLLHVMCRDAGLENKSVQCLLRWLGLLGAIKSGLEQIRIFFFSLCKFCLLQEVSLVTSLLLPHWSLSLQKVIKYNSNWGRYVFSHVSTQKQINWFWWQVVYWSYIKVCLLLQIWLYVSIIGYDRYLEFNPMLNDQWIQISVTKVYLNSVLLKYTILDRTVCVKWINMK